MEEEKEEAEHETQRVPEPDKFVSGTHAEPQPLTARTSLESTQDLSYSGGNLAEQGEALPDTFPSTLLGLRELFEDLERSVHEPEFSRERVSPLLHSTCEINQRRKGKTRTRGTWVKLPNQKGLLNHRDMLHTIWVQYASKKYGLFLFFSLQGRRKFKDPPLLSLHASLFPVT